MTERITVPLRWIPGWLTSDVVIPFAVTRLGLCLVAWVGFRLWHPATIFPESWHIDSSGNRNALSALETPEPHPFVNMWSRWDAGWYLEIARSGYSNEPDKPSSIAFFPLYPMTIRLIHALLSLPSTDYWFLVSGIFVSNIAVLVALAYLRALLAIDYPTEVVSRAILYLLVFPTSFFLSSVYAESLFLVLSIGAFFYARSGRWTMACCLAGLTAVCRSQGILILLPLIVEYAQQLGFRWRRIDWGVLRFALVPVPLALFWVWANSRFGSWRTIFDAQKPWGRQLMWPWDTLSWVLRHSPPLSPQHHEWLDFSFLGLLCAAAIIAIPRVRPAYAIYICMTVIFLSSWGMFGSVPRFDVVVFPLFIVLALVGTRFRTFHLAYLILGSMLAALFMIIHSQWNWIA